MSCGSWLIMGRVVLNKRDSLLKRIYLDPSRAGGLTGEQKLLKAANEANKNKRE